MSSIKSFKDVVVWQKGYRLALLIYELTAKFPRCEEFGLKSQMRRASVSVISNFAEGFKRFSYKDRIHFYKMAEGSLEEIKCQTMLAKDLNYLSPEYYDSIELLQDEVGRLLYALIRAQKQQLSP